MEKELLYPGFFNGEINIRRDQLRNLFAYVDVYKHEKGHEITGAGDPEDEFRQFFEKRLTEYIISNMQQTK